MSGDIPYGELGAIVVIVIVAIIKFFDYLRSKGPGDRRSGNSEDELKQLHGHISSLEKSILEELKPNTRNVTWIRTYIEEGLKKQLQHLEGQYERLSKLLEDVSDDKKKNK